LGRPPPQGAAASFLTQKIG